MRSHSANEQNEMRWNNEKETILKSLYVRLTFDEKYCMTFEDKLYRRYDIPQLIEIGWFG